MKPGAPQWKPTIGIAIRRRAIALAAILAPLILAACAANKPPPEIPDIPLSSYAAFELPPVTNQSGQPSGVEAAQIIGEGIAVELKNRGYNIVASAPRRIRAAADQVRAYRLSARHLLS